MLHKLVFYVFVCSITISCGNSAADSSVKIISQKIAKQQNLLKANLVYATEIYKAKASLGFYLTGRVGDSLLACSQKGRIELTDSVGSSKRLLIDLKAAYLVDKLFMLPRPNHKWFICWQETSMDGLRSCFAVFSSDYLKPDWKLVFMNPNPGRPVVDGTAAYISTLGMVSKILVENGDVVWKMDSLFNMKKLQFQEIQSAQVYSNEIIFIDFKAPGIRDYRDSLILDPITGQRKNK